MRENYQKPMKNWQFEGQDRYASPTPLNIQKTQYQMERGVNLDPGAQSRAYSRANMQPAKDISGLSPRSSYLAGAPARASTQDEATKAPKRKIKITDLPEAERIRWKNVHEGESAGKDTKSDEEALTDSEEKFKASEQSLPDAGGVLHSPKSMPRDSERASITHGRQKSYGAPTSDFSGLDKKTPKLGSV